MRLVSVDAPRAAVGPLGGRVCVLPPASHNAPVGRRDCRKSVTTVAGIPIAKAPAPFPRYRIAITEPSLSVCAAREMTHLRHIRSRLAWKETHGENRPVEATLRARGRSCSHQAAGRLLGRSIPCCGSPVVQAPPQADTTAILRKQSLPPKMTGDMARLEWVPLAVCRAGFGESHLLTVAAAGEIGWSLLSRGLYRFFGHPIKGSISRSDGNVLTCVGCPHRRDQTHSGRVHRSHRPPSVPTNVWLR